MNTFAQIADHFGVTRASVSQYITVATRLPEDFVAWLEGFSDPEFLARFSLRRLLAIARVEDRDDQMRQVEELVEAVSDSILVQDSNRDPHWPAERPSLSIQPITCVQGFGSALVLPGHLVLSFRRTSAERFSYRSSEGRDQLLLCAHERSS